MEAMLLLSASLSPARCSSGGVQYRICCMRDSSSFSETARVLKYVEGLFEARHSSIGSKLPRDCLAELIPPHPPHPFPDISAGHARFIVEALFFLRVVFVLYATLGHWRRKEDALVAISCFRTSTYVTLLSLFHQMHTH